MLVKILCPCGHPVIAQSARAASAALTAHRDTKGCEWSMRDHIIASANLRGA